MNHEDTTEVTGLVAVSTRSIALYILRNEHIRESETTMNDDDCESHEKYNTRSTNYNVHLRNHMGGHVGLQRHACLTLLNVCSIWQEMRCTSCHCC